MFVVRNIASYLSLHPATPSRHVSLVVNSFAFQFICDHLIIDSCVSWGFIGSLFFVAFLLMVNIFLGKIDFLCKELFCHARFYLFLFITIYHLIHGDSYEFFTLLREGLSCLFKKGSSSWKIIFP